MSLSGHFWTVVPSVWGTVFPSAAPESVPWTTIVPVAGRSPVRLSGLLREHAGSDTLIVVVHGLGGAFDSPYCLRAARVIDAHGISCLRLALRGADRSGEDFYHAGLVQDVEAALASPELARYQKLFVLGYSLGGHVSLHAAVQRKDPRLRGVAAVCAPLDLTKSSVEIDRPSAWPYRYHILRGLKDIYREVAKRHPVPTPLSRVLQVTSIREWDALTVVPRYGFTDIHDYYTRMSVGPRLAALQCPALLLPSRHDPMVPVRSFEALVAKPTPALSVRWVEDGGHVGYPRHITIDGQRSSSVEEVALRWFAEQ